MQEINRELFHVRGKNLESMETISRPTLSFWQDAWRRLKKDKAAIVGLVVIGRGVKTLIIAMCIVGWIGTCRFVRGEVYRLKEQDYVSAAKVLGVPDLTIIIRYMIPNIVGLLVTNLCMAIPGAIFNEAFLSYIGLGIAPPNCSWGILAKEGIKMLRVAPHQVIVPAFFICTTMLALNLLGDGLRDALDPKLRGTE